MSQVTKPVDFNVGPQERFQVFTQADASQGDILLVLASLGKTAQEIIVMPTNAMTIRVNVIQTVAPRRAGNDLMFTNHLPNLALSQQIISDFATPIPIPGGGELHWAGPVQDIELTSLTGNWTIIVK
jgi:hypothetical protein